MSSDQRQRIADLNAHAFANTRLITDLSRRNHELRTEHEQQQKLLAKFREELGDVKALTRLEKLDVDDLSDTDLENAGYDTTAAPTARQTCPLAPPPFPSSISNPSPQPSQPPTPFYVAARMAPPLRLSFIIPGIKGETLHVPIKMIDLAFILERRLEKKGWRKANVQQSVLDFLEVPLIRADWQGGVEVGNLLKD
ncbi:hypothetical protein EK21DRAFT_106846 [Setomelanomma holmii]|uniref:Uncharacterized protein n=1 Tax=Setomelanomma holmii TaxID=210430 RepID=A0A9P4HKF9_9PLEO|nr:hypothetical protein EK21DRAFT_106846 [Setomelanomma holmii]